MDPKRIYPKTLEERLIYWTIAGTWGLYLIGGLYIASPVLGWSLLAIVMGRRLGLLPSTAIDQRPLPIGIWIWILSMAAMAMVLFIGHIDFDLGLLQTLKSFIGWMKGWALMAVFAFVGATARIRPTLIYRANGALALQTILLTPLFLIAPVIGLPSLLYVSPLEMVGGPGPEFFSVTLYLQDPETGVPRWTFFAPWAPAAACIASVSFIFSLFEKSKVWKTIGILSAFIICILSQSRMSLIAIPAVSILVLVLSNMTGPIVFATGSVVCMLLLPFIDAIQQLIFELQTKFVGARASSSRVRSTLQSIATHRWEHEAPIWGHGTVERGPHLVEYMPIGSHHTWFGLLYVKGAVGMATLALPMACSIIEVTAKAQADRTARCALGILLVLMLFSFGENLEILVYLFWPGMIVVGTAMKHRLRNPFMSVLGSQLGAAEDVKSAAT